MTRLRDGTGPKPLHRQRSPWEKVEQPVAVAELIPPGQWFRRSVGDGWLVALVAEEPAGWHASISFRTHRGAKTRYPSWDELAHARYELLPHDIDVVMHLPDPEDYVALHDTTFHLHEHPTRDRRSAARREAAEGPGGDPFARFPQEGQP